MKKSQLINVFLVIVFAVAVFAITRKMDNTLLVGIPLFAACLEIYDKLEEMLHHLKGETEECKSTVPVDNAPTQKEVQDG